MKHVLSQLQENDILIYSDSGCVINPSSQEKMKEYIELTKQNECGSVGFIVHLEYAWTKMDLVEYLDCPQEHLNTPQLHATFFYLRKCPNTVAMVDLWYDTACIYPLLDDTPSHLPNIHGFCEHRHDQSIFSLIRKMMGTIVLDEPYPPYDNPIFKC